MDFKGFTANCKEATFLSLKKEEEKLSFSLRLKFFLHLAYCASCRQFVKQSTVITQLAAKYKDVVAKHPPDALSLEKKSAFQKQINENL